MLLAGLDVQLSPGSVELLAPLLPVDPVVQLRPATPAVVKLGVFAFNYERISQGLS